MSGGSLPGWLARGRPALPLAAALLGAALVTVGFWTVLPANLGRSTSSDFPGFYEPVARSIEAGRGIRMPDGAPATAYPPGYPVLVAGAFRVAHAAGLSERAGLALLTLAGMGLGGALIYTIARNTAGPSSAALATLVWMTYPLTLWLTREPNTEIAFIPPFYGAFLLWWYAHRRAARAGWLCILSGVLVGCAMLIRPIAIGAGLVLAALLVLLGRAWTPRRRAWLAALLVAGNCAAVLPWEIWAYRNTGRVVPLSTSGPASIRDGLTYAVDDKGYRQRMDAAADVAAVMRNIQGQAGQLTSVSAVAVALWREAVARPVAVAKLMLTKAARSWYGTDSGKHELLVLLVQAAYLALMLWGGVRAWQDGGRARDLAIGAGVMGLYFWAMAVVGLSIVRYMVPVIGLGFVLVPYGIGRLFADAFRPARDPDA